MAGSAPRHGALVFLAAALLTGTAGEARANFIILTGTSKLAVTTEGDAFRLSGTYEIQNTGDETARRVFLALNLGTWASVTEPQDIGVGQQGIFQVDIKGPLSHLECGSSAVDLCAGLKLPAVGALPLRITYHYQDQRAYPLSSVAVEPLTFGQLNAAQKHATQVTPVQATLKIEQESRREYRGRVGLRNLTDSEQRVGLSLVASREFAVEGRPLEVSIPARGQVERTIALTNHTALPGGSYAMPAIVQGSAEGARYLVLAWGMAATKDMKESRPFWLLGGIIAAAALAVLVVSVALWRQRRRTTVQSPSPT